MIGAAIDTYAISVVIATASLTVYLSIVFRAAGRPVDRSLLLAATITIALALGWLW